MSRPLRIAVVQFAPQIGRVQENLAKAREICASIAPHTVDLVCLPEMIFTGYAFPDAKAIAPYLEHPRTGPTAQFCRDLASALHCYVAAGYPERLSDEERSGQVESDPEGAKAGANSAVIYGPGGEWVGGYRKTNLFETDLSWAKPGSGFKTLSLPPPLRTLSLGICMDLNPQPPVLWTLADGPYELASYCLEETPEKPRTDVLLLFNAWLDTQADLDEDWDMSTLNYWLARLRPLWEKHKESDMDTSTEMADANAKETIVIICNRNGGDNGVLFAGTSAVFRLRQGSGEPETIGLFTRREQGVRIWTIQ